MAINFVETVFSVLARLYILYLLCVLLVAVDGRKHCENGGTLKSEGKQRQCECPPLFTGRYCEDYACLNGLSTGAQYDPDSTFFKTRCLCDSGWSGELCNISLLKRCGDKGKEINGKCECEKNFAGARCQYVTRCINGQLYNGRCACHYGWSGDFCEHIICHQGVADASNKTCICPPKYRGKFCDFCAKPSSSPPPECAEISGKRFIELPGNNNVLVFLGVVVIVILIMFLALLYIFCQKFSHSKRKSVSKTRKKTADVENQILKAASETRPLKYADAVYAETVMEEPNKLHFPPPPYEALPPAQGLNETQLPKKETNNRIKPASKGASVKFSLETEESVERE
uniref:EGF-like domain-containing protein n=1 Tax=Plectus sambesii TaxID=2011161 RepID=A0A914WAY4_9BILA